MSQDSRSYYAIIPANVRYDKELKPNAKLLYCEITALTNQEGYCWANNDYFAKLYQVSKETISRWISQLEQRQYIKTEIIYKEGTKEIKGRRIYLAASYPIDLNINTSYQNSHEGIDEKINTSCQKNQEPLDENVNTPIDKKVKDNNKAFNNKINNKLEYKDILSDSTKSNKPYEEIIQYLNQQTKKEFRNTKANQTLINGRLKDGFSVDDFKTVIDIKTSEWLNDPKMNEYLRPKTLFSPSNFEGYLNQKRKDSGANGDERLGKENAKSLSEWDLEELRKARELFEKYGDELEEVDF